MITTPAPAPTNIQAPPPIAPITTDTKGNPISGNNLSAGYNAPQNQPGYNPDLVNNVGQTNATVQAQNDANPTVAALYGLPTDPDSLAAAAAAAKTAASSPAQLAANQSTANSQVLQQYQSQIDGIVQAEAAARARITNAFAPIAADAVGSATAQQARGGNLGSNVGSSAIQSTQNAEASTLNQQVEASDEAYQSSLSDLRSKIVAAQNQKASDLNAASSAGADALITQVATNKANAQAKATSLVAELLANSSGIQLDPNGFLPTDANSRTSFNSTISQIAQLTGLLPATVMQLYQTQAAAQAATASSTKTAAAGVTAAQNAAAVAGNTTIPTGGTVIGPDGKVIASGQNPPTVIPLTSAVTRNTPGSGTTPTVLQPAATNATTTPPVILPTTTPTSPSAPAPQGNYTQGLESNGQASWQSLASLPGVSKAISLLQADYASPQDAYNQGIQWILNGGSSSGSGSTSAGGRGAVSGALSNSAGTIGSAILQSYGLTQQDANTISQVDAGLSSSLTSMMENRATVTQYIQKSQTQAQILNSAISTYGENGASPLVNSVIQSFQKNIYSDPSFNAMQVALGTFLKDYARVSDNATGSGAATTDASNAAAAEKLSTLMSQGSLQAALGTMWEEMNAQVSSLNTSVGGLQTQLSNIIQNYAATKNGGAGVGSTGSAASTTATASPQAPAGTTQMTGPDGQLYNVPNANVQAFIAAGGKQK